MKKALLSTVAALATIVVATGCDKSPTKPQIPQPATSRNYTVKVFNPSSGPLANATVLLQTAGQNYTAATNGSGVASLSIPNSVSLPTWVVLVATHASIMPEARTSPGAAGASQSVEMSTVAMPATLLVRDVYLHHLGNDMYDGSANSQLQLPSEGISRTYTFNLSSVPNTMPRIRLFARGIEWPTEIYINGAKVNTLGDSPSDGSIGCYTFRLSGTPGSILHTGANTLTVKTAPYEPSDPWDDIEYCGLMLYY